MCIIVYNIIEHNTEITKKNRYYIGCMDRTFHNMYIKLTIQFVSIVIKFIRTGYAFH